MKQLIYYTPGRFEPVAHLPGVKVWLALFKIFNHNISFIDRTNTIIPPVNVVTPDQVKLPVANPNFNMSFGECAVARASEIYNKHLTTGAPIRLSWSGGIDSSAALMGFIQLLGVDKAKQALQISMTSASVMENPYVWENLVRKENFKVINPLQVDDSWDGSIIMVNGETGDQVQGTDIYRPLITKYGPNAMSMLWTEDLVFEFIKFRSDLNDAEAEHLKNLLVNQVRQAPINIETFADFWWWLNFSCKWASTFYRLLTKCSSKIDAEFVDNYFFPFYASEEFQLWSMHKREEKHKGNWDTYKWKAKDFVCDTIGNDSFQQKHRQGSLSTILSHSKRYEAIDSEFNFYDRLVPEDWYNPNNSFKV
jgi:hypothetical protein